MATIRRIKRQKGLVYQVILRDKAGNSLKSKTFKKLGDAKLWGKKMEGDDDLMEALGIDGGKLLFSELVNEFALYKKFKDDTLIYRLNYWCSEIGNMRIKDISSGLLRQKLKDFQAGCCRRGNGKGSASVTQKPRSPGTVNRHRITLSAIFSFAVQQGYLLKNPVSKIPGLPQDSSMTRFLSDDERERLFAACKQSYWPRLYCLVVLACSTGMRKSELLNLRWADIDFDRGLAALEITKNGQPRVNPIPSAALAELEKFRDDPGVLVFPGRNDKSYSFRKPWNQALKQAGITSFRFHDLRHSASSYLAMSGASLIEIADILGHKSLQTTKRYSHLSTQHKAELLRRVMDGKIV